MMKHNKLIAVRSDLLTWERLTIISKFTEKGISQLVRQMLGIYTKQLYDKIPADRLDEIKKELQEK